MYFYFAIFLFTCILSFDEGRPQRLMKMKGSLSSYVFLFTHIAILQSTFGIDLDISSLLFMPPRLVLPP